MDTKFTTSCPPFVHAVLNLSDEERLALIPEHIAPPSVDVLTPNGDGSDFSTPFVVEEGQTREDLATRLLHWCCETLDLYGLADEPEFLPRFEETLSGPASVSSPAVDKSEASVVSKLSESPLAD